MRLVSSVLAAAAVAGALAACGDTTNGSPPPLTSKALPLNQGTLAPKLCPVEANPTSATSGRTQLRALERAYKRNPNRLVRTRKELSDSGKTTESELLSVRQLAERHLTFARKTRVPDLSPSADACRTRVIRRLEALLRS